MTPVVSLTAKERTLVGIGAAIASGCQPCTAKYVQGARSAGACERSIRLAIETALTERQKATDAMAAWAREVQGVVANVDDSFRVEKRRNTALIATVAAHVIRSAATLNGNLGQAQEQGWSNDQIAQALSLGQRVAGAAQENVESIVTRAGIGGIDAHPSVDDGPLSVAAQAQSSCGCANGCADA